MDTLVIGFGYRARHGKDTAVQAIIEARGQNRSWSDEDCARLGVPKLDQSFDIRRYSFADALKAEVAGREFELCMKHGIKYDPENKNRPLLQWWGTEYRRAQDPFYWVKQVAAKIAAEKPQIALISDVRFKNEFFWIRSVGGFTVKVTRVGFVDVNVNSAHKSENDLDGVQFDIDINRPDGDIDGVRADAVHAFDICLGWVTPEVPVDFQVPEAVSQ